MKKTLSFLSALCISVVPFLSHAAIRDISNDENWNVRIDGALEGDWLGYSAVHVVDLNNNGKDDLIVGSWFSDNSETLLSGSAWVIYDELLEDDFTGTGNIIDLSDSETWNIRFDGASAQDFLSISGLTTGDIDDDGKLDLLMSSYDADNNGRLDSGSLYVVLGSLLENYSGTGNVVSMADEENWNIRVDGGEAGDELTLVDSLHVVDLDQNGTDDLLVGSRKADGELPPDAGSLWIIYGELLAAYTGTGNTIDLADPSNWNIRYDAGDYDEYLSSSLPPPADIDGDGKLDLLLSAYAANNNADFDEGSYYIVPGSLVDDYSGTGNIVSLAIESNFFVRFDSQDTHSVFGLMSASGDFDGDNEIDLVIAASDADKETNGQGKGWVFLFSGDFFDGLTGVGNILSVATTSDESTDNYTLRYIGSQREALLGGNILTDDWNNDGSDELFFDAAFPDDVPRELGIGALYIFFGTLLESFDFSETGTDVVLTGEETYSVRYDGFSGSFFSQGGINTSLVDMDDDGSLDIVTSARGTDYNGRVDAGSVYIIFNFPHEIALVEPDSQNEGGGFTITGTVSYPNSTTGVEVVEWSFDDAFGGVWEECVFTETSDDGGTFVCETDSVDADETIFVRARDENGVFTPESSYASIDVEFIEPDVVDDEGGRGSSTRHSSGGSIRPSNSEEGTESISDRALEAELEERLRVLRAQLASLLQTPFSFDQTPTTCPTFAVTEPFTTDLQKGDISLDVLRLQRILNSNPATQIIDTGPGSSGQETVFFGAFTERSVVRLQELCKAEILDPSGLLFGTGRVGPKTRSLLNGVL